MAKSKSKPRRRRSTGPHWETLANYRPRGDSGDSVSAVRAVTRADIGTLADQYEITKIALPEESIEKTEEVEQRKRPSMGSSHEGRRRRRRRPQPDGVGKHLDVDA